MICALVSAKLTSFGQVIRQIHRAKLLRSQPAGSDLAICGRHRDQCIIVNFDEISVVWQHNRIFLINLFQVAVEKRLTPRAC